MSIATVLLSVLSLFVLTAQAVSEKSSSTTKPSTSDLVGGYTIISGEKFGIPEQEDRIKGSTVRFTEDRVVVADKDKKEVYGASYVLEPSTTPGQSRITMTSKLADKEGDVAHGLIEKKGDELRLIYALPGGAEPREFKTQDKQLMFTMKRRSE